jgi:glycosyltransferase involved in cell wall biosynthesis
MLGALDVVSVNIPYVGYGRMADSIRDALVDRVELRPDASAVVYGMTPDMVKGWYEGQRTAILTMWETTKIPTRFTRLLRMFDMLLVPCDWNADLYAPYHDNIKVVPLGIDVDFWRPQDVVDNDRFTFVTGGSGWKRKGIDQAIQAFRDAALPDSQLLIKVHKHILNKPASYDYGPGIKVVEKVMTPQEERAFYAQADCFISTTRGEGFGMIPLQNCALGNRVIAPSHTGHLMFDDLFDYGLSWDYEKAEMQYFSDIGDWFVPDHSELVEAMVDAYGKGRPPLWERQMRWEKAERWSWDATADRLTEVFPPGNIIENPVWKPAGKIVARVRTLKKIEADVGEFRLRFPAGAEVDVPVSTLAHLAECGLVTEI